MISATNEGTVNYEVQDGGTLLICPSPKHWNPVLKVNEPQEVSLGSINDDGFLLLRNKRHHTTILKSEKYTLACDCGYKVYYEKGTITTSFERNGYDYATQ